MKKNFGITSLILGIVIALISCGTQQKAVQTTDNTTTEDTTYKDVNPLSEVISVSDLIHIFEDRSAVATVTKKYGYKLKAGYEVYRLDKFSKMYYKNCALAKLLTKTAYADYPKPLAKGTSSYIAFKDNAIILAVFNQAAYDNLVAQVKANGFVLDMAGNEDYYKKEGLTIACSPSNKSIRIQ